MTDSTWQPIVDLLRGTEYESGLVTSHSPVHRVQFSEGLSDAEVTAVEARYCFQFPPDLCAFLQTALPYGKSFPDWRYGDEATLRDWLDTPLRGVLFDVEHNDFWLDEWGVRPRDVSDALELVTDLVRKAPQLIPVFSHRMIPNEPCIEGNPVFSVHQTDIIVYGVNLADYLGNEFQLPGQPSAMQVRPIRFWDKVRQ